MNKINRPNNATPTLERCVTSYPVRRAYSPGTVYPPAVPGVQEAIDLHCHAHEGQQDALALAKLASQSEMRGILFKTIGPAGGSRYEPARDVAALTIEIQRWADEEQIRPIDCWAGYITAADGQEPSAVKVPKASGLFGYPYITMRIPSASLVARISGGTRPLSHPPTPTRFHGMRPCVAGFICSTIMAGLRMKSERSSARWLMTGLRCSSAMLPEKSSSPSPISEIRWGYAAWSSIIRTAHLLTLRSMRCASWCSVAFQ
jgi:hypothetical protein